MDNNNKHDKKIEKLAEIVRKSKNIVFFGGAGVSTESNIPDFRSADGIFSKRNNRKLRPEELVSGICFDLFTEDFFSFYKESFLYPDAKPNKAHKALARLEDMGKLKAVITQNVDGLHQMAGSKNVLELHGSIHRNYCKDCKKEFDLDAIINSENLIPRCDACGGVIKPDVVLYGEPLDEETVRQTIKYISQADCLIIGGTSLVVYPAASFVDLFKGENLILINKTSTPQDYKASLTIHEPIGEVMAELMTKLSSMNN